jgi:hypothetical protein
MDFRFAWPFLIPIIAIVGGCTIAIVATIAKARVREAEIRERIAMIEKGLVPPPEVDPGAFDRALSRADQIASFRRRRHGSGRHRRTGITLMGIGAGLVVLIGFTSGEISNGLGVGGFIMIIGLAFLINSLFEDPVDYRGAPPLQSSRPPSTPPSASDQPRPTP